MENQGGTSAWRTGGESILALHDIREKKEVKQ
jgi:hypothetical protein